MRKCDVQGHSTGSSTIPHKTYKEYFLSALYPSLTKFHYRTILQTLFLGIVSCNEKQAVNVLKIVPLVSWPAEHKIPTSTTMQNCKSYKCSVVNHSEYFHLSPKYRKGSRINKSTTSTTTTVNPELNFFVYSCSMTDR